MICRVLIGMALFYAVLFGLCFLAEIIHPAPDDREL